jgi:cytoskeletal protein RodZ
MGHAQPATNALITRLKEGKMPAIEQMPKQSTETQRQDSTPSSGTERKSATTSPSNSSNSTSPSSASKGYWREPKTLKEFTSQVNSVASKVLNGQMDMDIARTYSGLARVIAQSVSTEVSRSRFLKMAPDLDFAEYGEDEE